MTKIMREIKFRGKATDTGEWTVGDLVRHQPFLELKSYIKGNTLGSMQFAPVVPESIGQFTGLHDKNGVEIYEGDILNVCNGSLNGVEWMEKPYAVEYVLNKGFNMCMFCWVNDGQNRMDSTHWCEVIGNIYENPELLK